MTSSLLSDTLLGGVNIHYPFIYTVIATIAIFESAQVETQMTNALCTNFCELPTNLRPQRCDAWRRSLYKHMGMTLHIMYCIAMAVTPRSDMFPVGRSCVQSCWRHYVCKLHVYYDARECGSQASCMNRASYIAYFNTCIRGHTGRSANDEMHLEKPRRSEMPCLERTDTSLLLYSGECEQRTQLFVRHVQR